MLGMRPKVQCQIVITTIASRAAAMKMARQIVAARLAACVQIVPIHSVYRWKGAVESAGEYRLEAKTRAALVPRLTAFIRRRHCYELPEIVAVPLAGGLKEYSDWIAAETLATPPGRKGFTLVEIMMVVAIIGLLCAIALPMFSKARAASQDTLFISSLRLATAAFEQYAFENSAYPPEALPAVMPAGMTNYLPKIVWTNRTPIGGYWDWDYLQFGGKIGVSVWFGDNDQDERMLEIDKKIDDGNLSSGIFQKRPGGYISIIEQKPVMPPP
jgi:prepilin-type N-terminal cleavage/methylation domain-containing protein